MPDHYPYVTQPLHRRIAKHLQSRVVFSRKQVFRAHVAGPSTFGDGPTPPQRRDDGPSGLTLLLDYHPAAVLFGSRNGHRR